jgi:putative glycerol-1-phosphate prenyltransferase
MLRQLNISQNNSILQGFQSSYGQIAVLIDPEKTNSLEQITGLVDKAHFAKINYFFVGGSTVNRVDLEKTISILKELTEIPVVIFPGHSSQLSEKADALLYLSLISGRNPDYLISHHVNSAMEVFGMNIEVLPTAYMLIDGGNKSSVAYVSQTTPIPRNQISIAVSTALAGVLQGKKILFFDAGSGAKESVPAELVVELRKQTNIPIIIGGGVRDRKQIEELKISKANVIVIGNKIEEDIDFLLEIEAYQKNKTKI